MTRVEIKTYARQRLKENQGNSIGVYVLYLVAGTVITAVTLSFGAFFLIPVLTVAMNGFFLRVYNGDNIGVSEWFGSMFNNYLRKLGGYWWMGLWTWLWSLLFVIPGIVKGIAYSLTPYILDEHPDVTATDALKLSMRITDGYKMDIFVAYLSFIGWIMLSGLTFGILEVLFVGPYRELTIAGIYQQLKENALANGTINQRQLDGYGVA